MEHKHHGKMKAASPLGKEHSLASTMMKGMKKPAEEAAKHLSKESDYEKRAIAKLKGQLSKEHYAK